MIIFDTNAVNRLNPSSNRADIIRKLRQSGQHKVAVPWMVLEEMVAHQAKIYLSRHQKAAAVLDELRDIVVWGLDAHLEELALERFQDHWREQYREIFEVIETSGEVARRALVREAMALPPAKQAERAEGGRDVAIWFSILEYMRANPTEIVHFVTDNHKDFGKGDAYTYPMNEDLHGMESRLKRLKNFNEVVATFTTAVSGQAAQAAAEALLRSPQVRDAIAEAAVLLESAHGFAGIDSASVPVQWSNWFLAPDIELLSVSAVDGHEIGQDVWYTATAEWLLFGPTFAGERQLLDRVASTWTTKILFSTNSEAEAPTLLSSSVPGLPNLEDDRCVVALARLKEELSREEVDIVRHVSSATHPGLSGIAETLKNFNLNLPKHDFFANVPKYDFSLDLPKYNFGIDVPKLNLGIDLSKYDLGFPRYALDIRLPDAPGTTGSVSQDAADVEASDPEEDSDEKDQG